MISAVDTNILMDLITDDPVYADLSERLLRQAYDEGGIVMSEVVYAEIAPQFPDQEQLDDLLEKLSVRLVCSNARVAYSAGRKWGEYRKAGGTRSRLLADFLIGAHAMTHAERLLTRDRGFYRQYFSDLPLLEE